MMDSSFEDLVIGIADGIDYLDSIFIEYELEDVSSYLSVDALTPVTDTLIICGCIHAYDFMLEY